MFNHRTAAIWLVGLYLPFSCLPAARPALADTASDIVTSGQGYVTQSLVKAGQYWNWAVSEVSSWMPGWPSPAEFIKGVGSDQISSETDFTKMMDIAGYSVGEVTVGVGIIPETTFKFTQTREISEYDRQYLQRLLRKQKQERSGPKAMAERTIVESVLEIQGLKNYDLTHIDVRLLPLPSISFTAEPKQAVFDPDTSYIVRKLDQLNEKLDSISKN